MPSVSQQYHVIDDADVGVVARIGDAQAGGHSFFLGNTLIGQGSIMLAVSLGKGRDLRGSVLLVASVAVDVQPTHDHVSVQVALSGGAPDPAIVSQGADAAPNGAVSFLTVISFV